VRGTFRFFVLLVFFGVALPALLAQGPDDQALLHPGVDSWPMYYGDYTGRRYSELTQINTDNASRLTLAWAFQTNEPDAVIKSTPLLVDGVLYFTIPDRVWAVDARTGRQIWSYSYPTKGGYYIGQRGVGIYQGRVFFLSNDCHLIALDARNGKELWKVEVADARLGFFATAAPQIVRNHVIIGASGDFYDLNGFIRSYDPETGKQQWQWNVIPKPGEPGSETWPAKTDAIQHGGGMPWMSGTYDPEMNLIFWGTGNPNPTMYGDDRPGSNLYTCSVVALDPDTGKLRWYFQNSPHDTHDWDSTQTPILVDAEFHGQPRKLLLQAARNGYFFVLDRTTGKALLSKSFVKINWSLGTDEQGRPIRNPEKDPSASGALVSPSSSGATNWYAPSFDPKLGLFYLNSHESYALFYHLTTGKAVGYAGKDIKVASHAYLKALDYQTGEARWTYDLGSGTVGAGILSTAGGIVFTGDVDGNLLILGAADGKVLWHSYGGAPLRNSPITYQLEGRQYIVVGVGGVLYSWALPQGSAQTTRAGR
jgi:alcohol dehydrogenase (cytochrome c)